jgi:hypothetical protein
MNPVTNLKAAALIGGSIWSGLAVPSADPPWRKGPLSSKEAQPA